MAFFTGCFTYLNTAALRRDAGGLPPSCCGICLHAYSFSGGRMRALFAAFGLVLVSCGAVLAGAIEDCSQEFDPDKQLPSVEGSPAEHGPKQGASVQEPGPCLLPQERLRSRHRRFERGDSIRLRSIRCYTGHAVTPISPRWITAAPFPISVWYCSLRPATTWLTPIAAPYGPPRANTTWPSPTSMKQFAATLAPPRHFCGRGKRSLRKGAIRQGYRGFRRVESRETRNSRMPFGPRISLRRSG